MKRHEIQRLWQVIAARGSQAVAGRGWALLPASFTSSPENPPRAFIGIIFINVVSFEQAACNLTGTFPTPNLNPAVHNVLLKSMDKKDKHCQGESAAARLGQYLQKDPDRCNQEENSTEMGQKIFPYITLETAVNSLGEGLTYSGSWGE